MNLCRPSCDGCRTGGQGPQPRTEGTDHPDTWCVHWVSESNYCWQWAVRSSARARVPSHQLYCHPEHVERVSVWVGPSACWPGHRGTMGTVTTQGVPHTLHWQVTWVSCPPGGSRALKHKGSSSTALQAALLTPGGSGPSQGAGRQSLVTPAKGHTGAPQGSAWTPNLASPCPSWPSPPAR